LIIHCSPGKKKKEKAGADLGDSVKGKEKGAEEGPVLRRGTSFAAGTILSSSIVVKKEKTKEEE